MIRSSIYIWILKLVCSVFGHDWPGTYDEHCHTCKVHWSDGSNDYALMQWIDSSIWKARRHIHRASWWLGMADKCPHCHAKREDHGTKCVFEVPF